MLVTIIIVVVGNIVGLGKPPDTDDYEVNLVELERTQGSFSIPSPGI